MNRFTRILDSIAKWFFVFTLVGAGLLIGYSVFMRVITDIIF